jgi:hypothetical protein
MQVNELYQRRVVAELRSKGRSRDEAMESILTKYKETVLASITPCTVVDWSISGILAMTNLSLSC